MVEAFAFIFHRPTVLIVPVVEELRRDTGIHVLVEPRTRKRKNGRR